MATLRLALVELTAKVDQLAAVKAGAAKVASVAPA